MIGISDFIRSFDCIAYECCTYNFFIFLVCFIFVYTYNVQNKKIKNHLSALAVNKLKTETYEKF